MTQVVNAGTNLAPRGLDTGTPQYVHKHPRDAVRGVARASLIMPEQRGIGILRRFRLPSRFQIITQGCKCAVGQGQDSGFEELRLPNGDRAGLQIDIAQVQARNFAQSQPCAVGKHQHRIETERTQRCARRWIRTSNIKEKSDFFWAVNVGPAPLQRGLLLWSRVRAWLLNAGIEVTLGLSQGALQSFAFGGMIGGRTRN